MKPTTMSLYVFAAAAALGAAALAGAVVGAAALAGAVVGAAALAGAGLAVEDEHAASASVATVASMSPRMVALLAIGQVSVR
jgi:hypothetical protein